ncbi:MAG: hypothetical protein II934_10155 [Prevotella sp.]|nr:hypothetical protein [Prevotella sp.]
MVENLLQHMTECGCSPFFVTSAISSLKFGKMGRQHQMDLLADSIAFKERMLQLRNDFSEERLKAQIDFRRESYELGRKYQILMMQQLNENRQKEVEFKYLCENCWPLTIDVRTVMEWQKEILNFTGIVPMRVLIAKTDINTYKRENGCYENFCSELTKVGIPNLLIEQAAWKEKCQSPMSESLNINYIMQGIPTLVIYPYKIKGTFHLEFATWSFSRGLGAMILDKAISFPYSLENADAPEIMYSMEAVAGVVRDNYMVLEYQKPAVYPTLVRPEILEYKLIKGYLDSQYRILEQIVNTSESFRQLCSDNELKEIELSLTNIKKKLICQ